jgi:ubiquinone/menaquinone biosynthesis C-methylase UbiE
MKKSMRERSEQNARRYYDDFSDAYERGRGYGYHQMIDDLEVQVTAPYARGARVLELGCGTGLILARIARIAEEAVGIDLSEGMAQQARDRGLDARIGSVCDLPFEDEEFDLTYSFKVLAHVPDIEAALREAARVTRPGGHLLLEFYNPWSLRYLAKKVAGPQPISDDRTEADIFTRWDSLRRSRTHALRRRPPHPVDGTRLEPSRALGRPLPASILRRLPDRGLAQILTRCFFISANVGF